MNKSAALTTPILDVSPNKPCPSMRESTPSVEVSPNKPRPSKKEFILTAHIQHQTFEGQGHGFYMAKSAASVTALKTLFNITWEHQPGNRPQWRLISDMDKWKHLLLKPNKKNQAEKKKVKTNIKPTEMKDGNTNEKKVEENRDKSDVLIEIAPLVPLVAGQPHPVDLLVKAYPKATFQFKRVQMSPAVWQATLDVEGCMCSKQGVSRVNAKRAVAEAVLTAIEAIGVVAARLSQLKERLQAKVKGGGVVDQTNNANSLMTGGQTHSRDTNANSLMAGGCPARRGTVISDSQLQTSPGKMNNNNVIMSRFSPSNNLSSGHKRKFSQQHSFNNEVKKSRASNSHMLGPQQSSFTRGPRHSSFMAGPDQSSFTRGPRHSSFMGGPDQSTFTRGPQHSSFMGGPDPSTFTRGPQHSSFMGGSQHSSFTDTSQQSMFMSNNALQSVVMSVIQQSSFINTPPYTGPAALTQQYPSMLGANQDHCSSSFNDISHKSLFTGSQPSITHESMFSGSQPLSKKKAKRKAAGWNSSIRSASPYRRDKIIGSMSQPYDNTNNSSYIGF